MPREICRLSTWVTFTTWEQLRLSCACTLLPYKGFVKEHGHDNLHIFNTNSPRWALIQQHFLKEGYNCQVQIPLSELVRKNTVAAFVTEAGHIQTISPIPWEHLIRIHTLNKNPDGTIRQTLHNTTIR